MPPPSRPHCPGSGRLPSLPHGSDSHQFGSGWVVVILLWFGICASGFRFLGGLYDCSCGCSVAAADAVSAAVSAAAVVAVAMLLLVVAGGTGGVWPPHCVVFCHLAMSAPLQAP